MECCHDWQIERWEDDVDGGVGSVGLVCLVCGTRSRLVSERRASSTAIVTRVNDIASSLKRVDDTYITMRACECGYRVKIVNPKPEATVMRCCQRCYGFFLEDP